MTLKECKNEIQRLQNNLRFYLNKKKINFEKTQPSSIKLKEITVDGGFKDWDPFMSYMIKDEECDKEIYLLQKELNNYRTRFTNEMLRMLRYDDLPLIVYLKEEENKNWKDIDNLLHYAEGTTKKSYFRSKK